MGVPIGDIDVNPAHTYKNRLGIYYFRLVLSGGNDIRFSLRTRVASEARPRAYRAWLSADSLKKNGYTNADIIRASIQSSAFSEEGMSTPSKKSNIPELVAISAHLNSHDTEVIKNAITTVFNDGGRILVPYSPGAFIPCEGADDRCSIFQIHDPEYEEAPTLPVEVETVYDQHVVLTTGGVNAARFSEGNTFVVDEFYSYDHRNNWSEKNGFSYRFIPSPFLVSLTEVCITKANALTTSTPGPALVFSASTKPCKSIREALAEYSEDKYYYYEKWTPRTKRDYEFVFETFVEIIGNKKVDEITQADVKKYARTLKHLPPNRKDNPIFRGLNASEAASLNKERGGDTLSNASKNKFLERLSGPFNLFVGNDWCRYNFFNNVESYSYTRSDKLNARESFENEDLVKMFEGRDSIKMLSAKSHMPSRPWGLLIALFTGARASEIFSLTIEDIQEHNGTLYFDIKDREGHNRLKTDAAVRGIPIHDKLIELGFSEYVEKAKEVQSGLTLPLLFPEITKSKDHGWARNTTRWINEKYLTRLGIKTNKLKVYHSFRHLVSNRFKHDWKANQLKVSAYIGHHDNYGNSAEWKKGYGSPFSPSDLKEIADAIDYGLDFSEFKTECLDKINLRRIKI